MAYLRTPIIIMVWIKITLNLDILPNVPKNAILYLK